MYIKYSDISAPGCGQGLQKTAKLLLAYPKISFLLHAEIKCPKSRPLVSFLFSCHYFYPYIVPPLALQSLKHFIHSPDFPIPALNSFLCPVSFVSFIIFPAFMHMCLSLCIPLSICSQISLS